jgi:transposase
VADGSGIPAALDYSLKRWGTLGRILQDGEVSTDNNCIERLMRP